MDHSNQAHSLINIEPQEKLSYISIINSEPVKVESSQQGNQQPLSKVESNLNGNSCLYDDGYDDDDPKPKLRKKNPENWKQNVRKRNKNKGLEYIRTTGEVCERKKLGPPCTCKEKCYLKIGMDACEKIFQNFWKLGDHALQNAYIAGCVRIFLPKHCYKKDGIPSRRFFSRNFHVTVNGIDTEVCKQAFLNMHAISNGRLDRLLKKKQEIGNTGFDERGRHSNKVNKIPIEKIKLVRKHIDSVRQRSGYTGKRKPKKVEILPGLLNIRTMYRSYKEEIMSKGLEPVSEYRYRKIFHTDFHLDFGKTVVANTPSNEPTPNPQLPQDLQQLTTENQQINEADLPTDKQFNNKLCQRNNSIKKSETFANITLQGMNVNVHVNSNFKSNKSVPVYNQLGGTQGSKECQMRTQEMTPYILSQEVFRLDYSPSYNNPQQNWIFPNQN